MATPSVNLPYVLLTSVLVVAVVLVFAVYRPAWQDIQEQRGTLSRLQAEAVSKRTFLQTLDHKLAQLEGNRQYEQQLAVVLPTDEAFDELTRVLARGAGAAGVAVVTVTNTSEQARGQSRLEKSRGKGVVLPPNVEALGATVEVRGTYQQQRQFLEQLERSVRLIDVTSWRLARQEQQPDQLVGRYELKFYRYLTEEDHG